MEDIVPKLLEQIQGQFSKLLESDQKIKSIYKKVKEGTATHADTYEFANEVGKLLAKCLQKELSSDILPDGKMYYNIAERILNSVLKNNYNLVIDTASDIQKILNQKAGVGINAIIPKIKQGKINGLINRISSEEVYDNISWTLQAPIVNFTMSAADDFVQTNVEFHGKSGLTPKIVRIAGGNCCKWCRGLAGTYIYPDVPKSVYQRHDNCRCIVTYNPVDGKGKIQNVHSKDWISEEGYVKIERQKREKELKLSNGLAAQVSKHPKMLQAYTPESLKKALEAAGYDVKPLGTKSRLKGIPFEEGGGYRVSYGGDRYLQYHPEKYSHHGGAYYKFSSGKTGNKRYHLNGDEKND